MNQQLSKKALALITSAVILACATVGSVAAYLISRAGAVNNEFQPVRVTCSVEESMVANVQRNVSVKNTGDVDAYIRATLVATWVNDEGKVHATSPVEGVDYVVIRTNEGWKQHHDGYWYHLTPVAPGAKTGKWIDTASVLGNAPAGFHLKLQVVATAIQAEPDDAVHESWGISVRDGALVIGE